MLDLYFEQDSAARPVLNLHAPTQQGDTLADSKQSIMALSGERFQVHPGRHSAPIVRDGEEHRLG